MWECASVGVAVWLWQLAMWCPARVSRRCVCSPHRCRHVATCWGARRSNGLKALESPGMLLSAAAVLAASLLGAARSGMCCHSKHISLIVYILAGVQMAHNLWGWHCVQMSGGGSHPLVFGTLHGGIPPV
jgi:hypothetical protein